MGQSLTHGQVGLQGSRDCVASRTQIRVIAFDALAGHSCSFQNNAEWAPLVAFTDPFQITVVRALCDDGFDNDGDGRLDLEDPDCDSPRDRTEATRCGLGYDLALLVPLLMALRGRRRAASV